MWYLKSFKNRPFAFGIWKHKFTHKTTKKEFSKIIIVFKSAISYNFQKLKSICD